MTNETTMRRFGELAGTLNEKFVVSPAACEHFKSDNTVKSTPETLLDGGMNAETHKQRRGQQQVSISVPHI